jgi:hypothetical protein
VVIVRCRLRSLLAACAFAGACAASVACNAITGTGKYDLVDCPSGTCGDGGNGSSPGQNGDAAGSSQGGDSAADAATTPIDCGPGLAPVTLTVTGAGGGSVSAKSGGNLTVAVGTTDTACLGALVELRTSGPTADWTGPGCKDGNTAQDRCEFGVPMQGIAVTAALR